MLNFHLSELRDADRLPPSEWVSVWIGRYLRVDPEVPQEPLLKEEARPPRPHLAGQVEARLETYMARLWPQAATHAMMAAALHCHVDHAYQARRALEDRGLLVRIGVEAGPRVRGGRRQSLFRWRPPVTQREARND